MNVSARTWRGSMMLSRDCQAMRRVSTRVLPEPAPARIASGAARLVTASRCVASRPRSRSSPPGARYWRGTTLNGDPNAARAGRKSGRPRVVSAALQLGSPRGHSRKPFGFRPRADRPRRPKTPPADPFHGAPRDSVPAAWLRLPHLPGVVPFDPVAVPAFTGPRIVRTRRGEIKRQNVPMRGCRQACGWRSRWRWPCP